MASQTSSWPPRIPPLPFLNHRDTEIWWTPRLEATCLDVKPDIIRPTAFQRRPNCAAPPLPDIGFQSRTYFIWMVNIWVMYEKCTVIMKKPVLILQYKTLCKDSGLYLKPLKKSRSFSSMQNFCYTLYVWQNFLILVENIRFAALSGREGRGRCSVWGTLAQININIIWRHL